MSDGLNEFRKLMARVQATIREDPARAVELLDEAVRCAESLDQSGARGDARRVPQLKLWKVRCLVQLGKHAEGIRTADEVLARLDLDSPVEMRLEALHLKAAILQEMGQGSEALGVSERASLVARESRKPDMMADSYCRYGELLRSNGQVEKARSFYARSLEHVPEERVDLRVATLCNLGNALLALGHPERALHTFDRALKIAADHQSVRRGPSQAGRGNALQELGRLEEARQAYLAAQEDFRDMGDSQTASGIGLNLGHLLSQEGNLREARAVFESCLGTFKGPFAAQRKASAMGGLAEITACTESRSEAAVWYHRAREAYASCGDCQGEAYARLGCGHMHMRGGDYEKAAEVFAQLLEDFGSMEHPAGCISTWELLAEMARDTGAPDKARETLERALEKAREVNDPHHLASLLAGRADAELRAGLVAEAGASIEEARAMLADAPMVHLQAQLRLLAVRQQLARSQPPAFEQLDSIERLLERTGHRFMWLEWAEVQVLALRAADRSEEADALLERARAQSRELGWLSWEGVLARLA